MSSVEFLIVLACLGAGYWIVSKLMSDKPQPKDMVKTVDVPAAWHEVLNVPPDAADGDIRNAYKSLMGQYHPDKVAALGDELRALAERKSKEITSAYRQAMRSRGQDA